MVHGSLLQNSDQFRPRCPIMIKNCGPWTPSSSVNLTFSKFSFFPTKRFQNWRPCLRPSYGRPRPRTSNKNFQAFVLKSSWSDVLISVHAPVIVLDQDLNWVWTKFEIFFLFILSSDQFQIWVWTESVPKLFFFSKKVQTQFRHWSVMSLNKESSDKIQTFVWTPKVQKSEPNLN